MSIDMTTFTVTLSDEMAERAERSARAQGRPVEALLAGMLALQLHVGREPALVPDDAVTQDEISASARMLEARAKRMDAGAGVDAKEAIRSIAARLNLPDPSRSE